MTIPCSAPSISSQPADTRGCTSGLTTLHVAAIGGSLAYQWSHDGVAIDISVNPSAATPSLAINHAQPADAGAYDCVISNTCGSVNSAAATVSVCIGDFNCDGFVSGDDFDGYVGDFEQGEPTADTNGDGFVSGDDFDVYVLEFEAGC